MSHPDRLPDLFLDRSLGRIQVPRILRAAGLRLVTLAEHYGIPADEEVVDTEWLELAGRNGWVVFLKDARIRSRTVERETVMAFGVRCFCITRQDLTAAQMAERYLGHLDAITAACDDPRSSTPCTTGGSSASTWIVEPRSHAEAGVVTWGPRRGGAAPAHGPRHRLTMDARRRAWPARHAGRRRAARA